MKFIPRSDAKRVYALLAFVPAIMSYLAVLAYKYFGNYKALADVALVMSVLIVTASLTVLFTKLQVAWWLRRCRFVLARGIVVLASLILSFAIVVFVVMRYT